jgi:signal peptidase I
MDRRKGSTALVRAALPDQLCHQLLLLLLVGVLSVACYYLVSRFVATTVIVQGRSMTPTLQDGDRYILNRWSYFCRTPQRGDLVVVRDPGHNDFAVKRVIGMPCESLLFKRGKIMVNGKQLLEPYLPSGTQTFLPDTREKLLLVGKDQYFVLGDNRGNSEDSRYYGALRRDQIVGSICR